MAAPMRLKMLKVLCLLVLTILPLSTALYEDQAGTFDWRLQYIGKPLFVEYLHNSPRIIVGTEQNVVAAINAKNGQIGWRQVLEKGEAGRIDAMQVQSNNVIVVLGGGQQVRSFSATNGLLNWETTILTTDTNIQNTAKLLVTQSGHVVVLAQDRVALLDLSSGKEEWTYRLVDSATVTYTQLGVGADDVLYVVGVGRGSHVRVISLLLSEGKEKRSQTVPAPWIQPNTRCLITNAESHLVCVSRQTGAIQSVDLNNTTTFSTLIVQETVVDGETAEFILPLAGSNAGARDSLASPVALLRANINDFIVLSFSKGTAKLSHHLPGVSTAQIFEAADKCILMTLSRAKQPDSVVINGYDLVSRAAVGDMSQTIKYPKHHGRPLQMYGALARHNDAGNGYSIVIVAEDHSLTFYQHSGKVSWVREEALASILSVEMVDLPVSQIMAKMEDEFGTKDSVGQLFVKRFKTQFSQLVTFIVQLKQRLRAMLRQHQGTVYQSGSAGGREADSVSEAEVVDVMEEGESETEEGVEEDYLTRDDFNLHKMIVVVTRPGKIFGLDNANGRSVWKTYLPNMQPFSKAGVDILPLFVQRTTAHFPHQPLCTVLGKDRVTKKVLLYSFHPISGAMNEDQPSGGRLLDHDVISAVMLQQMDEHFQHPILLLDSSHQYHVYPSAAEPMVREISSSLFTFIADVDAGQVLGYRMKNVNDKLKAESLWTVDVNKNVQTITKVVAKPALEHVHSQGIVLDDRSVLYKYINPNLITVIAEGEDPVQKAAFFTVYLIDTVTGNLVFHCAHRKAKGPVHVIHSENWIAYNYWNQKLRRTELAILELYEGAKQSNATAFSSFYPPPPPIVMRQAYIFPGFISAMATTVTEKGITSKELLFALETGGILTLPKILVDPRRPEVASHEPREEGSQIIVPYVPELPRPPQNFINYYQTVFNIRAIHTAPAGLESTSLVLSYGLDIFYTRITPSKMFDVLKEDFDYFFISSVLIGMITVSIISQKLATRKALNRAWK